MVQVIALRRIYNVVIFSISIILLLVFILLQKKEWLLIFLIDEVLLFPLFHSHLRYTENL